MRTKSQVSMRIARALPAPAPSAPTSSSEDDMAEQRRYQNLINGELVPAASGRYLESVNPTTGEVWAEVPLSDGSDVGRGRGGCRRRLPGMVEAHRAAARRRNSRTWPTLFAEHGEELAQLESTDNGTLIGVTRPMNGMAMEFLWKRARIRDACSHDR